MKRIISFIFALTIVSGVLTGCADFEFDLYDASPEQSYNSYSGENTESPESQPETEIQTENNSEITSEEIPEETSGIVSENVPEENSEKSSAFNDYDDETYVEYYFRTESQLDQHFSKHGGEFEDWFGYDTAEDYEKGASDVINNPDALYKTEAEDGDGVYYLEDTNEFVILSTDGYIRTYFRPTAGIDYFNRQ
ncbi:MAG: hypothetical protein K2N49_04810 [Ruminococcus sp.]|nr:hypothetical protein [Ruminococcus sp.]MDE7226160.1 hypothetical protein [Ruminococcus sp.]